MNAQSIKLDYDKAYSRGLRLAHSDDFYDNRKGLFILIGIQSALRNKDIFNITKQSLEFEKDGMWIHFKAFKTGKAGRTFVDPIIMKLVKQAFETNKGEFLFHNPAYKTLLSHNWINGHLKKEFPSEYINALKQGKTIGSHSLRKTAAFYIYQKFGLETARYLLQHRDYKTTKIYIEIAQDDFEDKIRGAFN